MAAFNTSTFAYNSYATARPDYPSSLYDLVLSYHSGGRGHLLDLGCGHGTVTRALAARGRFDRATGADPSNGMLDEARRLTASTGASNISFIQGTAEAMLDIKDQSVDLVVSAQAAHWFTYPPETPNVWDEMRRVLKPSGTVAYWGYADTRFPNSSFASAVLHKWAYGKGEIEEGREGLGSYWSFPGRARIESLYGNLPLPSEGRWLDVKWIRNDQRSEEDWFEDVKAVSGPVDNDGRDAGVSDKDKDKLKMEKTMTIRDVKRFMRTWSAFHNWGQKHSDLKAREEGGQGDVVDWVIDEIARQQESWNNEEQEVVIAWPVGMLLMR